MLKKILALFITMVFTVCCFTACGDNAEGKEGKTWEKEEVYKYTFNNVGENDFVVGAFSGPNGAQSVNGINYPSIINDSSFSALKEAGVNTVFGIENWVVGDTTKIEQTLELTDKYNLNYVVYDTSVIYMAGTPPYVADSKEAIKERLELYDVYDSFAGFYSKDEPNISYYADMRKAEDLVESLYPEGDKICYSNLLPMFENNWVYTEDTENLIEYDEYVRRYMEEVQPKYVSFDWYPFGRTAGTIYGYWFESLATIRKYANKAGVPFWVCIQAGGLWENEINRLPSETEFNWNINSALCFGAKGITYFPGVHSFYHVDNENGNEGLLDLNGEKTRYWYYANTISKHLNAIDDVLTNCASLGIMQSGSIPKKISNKDIEIFDNFRELESISGDLIVGCFDYNGKTALYVMNANLSDSTTAVMNFDDRYGYNVIKEGEESQMKGKKLEIKLDGGEGVLITLK